MFLRNVGIYLAVYTTPRPRRTSSLSIRKWSCTNEIRRIA
jgi:hypothetical protein